MKSLKRFPLLILVAGFLFAGFALTRTYSQRSNPTNSQKPERPPQPQKKIDTSKFPITDYFAAKPSDPKERLKREAIGKKYNSKYTPAISENSKEIFYRDEWDVKLSALPVDRSSVIVLGEVLAGHAYLSEDKTNIYSEFLLKVSEILKNDTEVPLVQGQSMAAERFGGQVKFPSGHLVTAQVSHQDMPKVGNRYVLFLAQQTYDGRPGKDFYIVTGYQLIDDQVFPLDNLPKGHPLTTYIGTSQNEFLNDLLEAISKSSLTSHIK